MEMILPVKEQTILLNARSVSRLQRSVSWVAFRQAVSPGVKLVRLTVVRPRSARCSSDI